MATPQPTYTCNICMRVYTLKGVYIDHIKTHTKDATKYECTDCPCFFKNRGHLITHINEVHRSRPRNPFECDICSKRFTTKRSIIHHLNKIHSNTQRNAPYKCEYCTKAYCTKNTLKWHVKVNHTKGYIRAKCPYCPANFKWPHHLKVHIRKMHITNGEMPKDLLKNGLSSIRKKTNDCIFCNAKFEAKLNLMIHLKKDHKQDIDIFKCCKCTAVFTMDGSLKVHLEEHERKKTGFMDHRCDQCFPNIEPKKYIEEKTIPTKSEIESEILDFELTLMEHNDLKEMIECKLIEGNELENPYNVNEVEQTSNETDNDKLNCNVELLKEVVACNEDELVDSKLKYIINKELRVCLKRIPVERGTDQFNVLCDNEFVELDENVSRNYPKRSKSSHNCYMCASNAIVVQDNKITKKCMLSPTKRLKHKKSNVKCVTIKSRSHECGNCKLFFKSKLELLRHISDVHMFVKL